MNWCEYRVSVKSNKGELGVHIIGAKNQFEALRQVQHSIIGQGKIVGIEKDAHSLDANGNYDPNKYCEIV